MYNLYLLNEAIDVEELELFENGINCINDICTNRDEFNESLYRDKEIWSKEFLFGTIGDLFGRPELSPQFKMKILPIFLERGLTAMENITSEEELDAKFVGDFNAFLGIDFSNSNINNQRQICTSTQFLEFKDFCLSQIGFRELWGKREELFPNLILCGQVENQIARIGDSSHLNQIVERLKTLDKYVKDWNSGSFSYKNVNRSCNLRISPESTQTMDKFGNQRIFRLPELGTKTCELHIKTGDLRFHFYPDNNSKSVYVAYIGQHLDTISN